MGCNMIHMINTYEVYLWIAFIFALCLFTSFKSNCHFATQSNWSVFDHVHCILEKYIYSFKLYHELYKSVIFLVFQNNI